MKSGSSSLNPFAASYVPLYKREVKIDTKTAPNCVSPKNHPVKSPQASSVHTENETADKHIVDEGFEMDLAYLQMAFSGVSDQSLADVYLANKGDLDATVDMLNQLELFEEDYYENLPDALDIGDISESPKCETSLPKKLAGESSGSVPRAVSPN